MSSHRPVDLNHWLGECYDVKKSDIWNVQVFRKSSENIISSWEPIQNVWWIRESYNKLLSGYQPGQVVEQWKNRHFEDRLRPRPEGADIHAHPTPPPPPPPTQG